VIGTIAGEAVEAAVARRLRDARCAAVPNLRTRRSFTPVPGRQSGGTVTASR